MDMQRCVTAMVAAVVMTAGLASAGPKWTLDDDSWMSLNVLGQIHASYTDEAIDTTDVYLRRGRLIVAGQILDGAKFFVETDYDNAGRQGYDDVSMDIQDAFVDLRLGQSEHWVKAGLILLPFSFETHSSAASLLGLDYNSEVIKLSNSFVWRDYGAEVHGRIGSKFAYAVGAFDGYETVLSNPESEVRLTGHVAVNLLGDVESGWFNIQDRKGAAGNYLSLGLGSDYQAKASLGLDVPAGTGGTDATAFVADFQSGFALSETVGLTVNGAWYDWDSIRYDGNTAFVEAGVQEGQVMATVKFTHQDAAKLATQTDYTLGLHYFIKGHNLRTGIEYRWGDNRDFALVGIQFLL
jgi:hypothetical protein